MVQVCLENYVFKKKTFQLLKSLFSKKVIPYTLHLQLLQRPLIWNILFCVPSDWNKLPVNIPLWFSIFVKHIVSFIFQYCFLIFACFSLSFLLLCYANSI